MLAVKYDILLRAASGDCVGNLREVPAVLPALPEPKPFFLASHLYYNRQIDICDIEESDFFPITLSFFCHEKGIFDGGTLQIAGGT